MQYLQAQPFVRGDRVGLMGWSQGGGVVLLSINDKSIGRPAALSQDFKAAVSFYPGVCNDKFQSKPWTQVEPQGWTTKLPLLVLFGAADTWTPLAPCEEFLGRAKARGNPVELKSYPRSHAFAGTSGSDNIVAFKTQRYHTQSLIVQGPGAGPDVTAGGVFADLLRLASYVGGGA